MQKQRKLVVLLKGYPRLSETFIAQELLGLERAGFELVLMSMRRPTDKKRHPIHDEIQAPVHYLPEYLHEEPLRVLKSLVKAAGKPGFFPAFRDFLRDLPRDFTRNRVRRFGQAAVLAAEWPDQADWLHVHFIHTPAAVGRYASKMLGMPWSVSAHAKDIWTTADWELSDKLAETNWTVTCTRSGFEHLRNLSGGRDNVHLSYHGLDLDRFPSFKDGRPMRDGSNASDPVTVLSVGRAVDKKGFDILLKALALLPADLHWRMEHIGGGEELPKLKALADKLGIADRIRWNGALAQQEVLRHYRTADLFALACRISDDGDRDGLPNVLVEAASQSLACVSTAISGIPEMFTDGKNGYIVEPENPTALAGALEAAIRNPAQRQEIGAAAEAKVRSEFDHHQSISQLAGLLSA
ncbi:glycosyltransferase [Rhizobium sp. XQZ8]|uniref:glycosyltransferase n=1 Tax=Rhizobium populisoli TaxID=2859785 RepID=UPI001CA5E662|nr:glycosyltransferase [Rhizobium populisoli]MBW6422390.1 glycosyltransferase [Rhizobium populisoli]